MQAQKNLSKKTSFLPHFSHFYVFHAKNVKKHNLNAGQNIQHLCFINVIHAHSRTFKSNKKVIRFYFHLSDETLLAYEPYENSSLIQTANASISTTAISTKVTFD